MLSRSGTNRFWPYSGFTLIEILVVVSIIAILVGIAVANFLDAQSRAKAARVRADLRTIAMALETYHIDNRAYPPEGYPHGLPGVGTLADGQLYQIDEVWDSGLSLIRLTTPIAYLTSTASLRDPYLYPSGVTTLSGPAGGSGGGGSGSGGGGGGGGGSSVTLPSPLFNYIYVDYMTFGMLHLKVNGISFHGYALVSVGPDQTPSDAVYAPYLFTIAESGYDAMAYDTIFDPTNGTVSGGDIIRMGGESTRSI